MTMTATDKSYTSMLTYVQKAVEAREDIYQADAEALDDLLTENTQATPSERLAALQKGRGAAVVKEAIANNRWHMMQAITFGVASIARAAWGIHGELVKIREILETKS